MLTDMALPDLNCQGSKATPEVPPTQSPSPRTESEVTAPEMPSLIACVPRSERYLPSTSCRPVLSQVALKSLGVRIHLPASDRTIRRPREEHVLMRDEAAHSLRVALECRLRARFHEALHRAANAAETGWVHPHDS